MRILYVLTSLGIGGAERQVTALARRMALRGHAVELLVLRPRLAEEWRVDLPVHTLGMGRNPASLAAGLLRLRTFLRGFSPDVMHSHGFHGNLVSRPAALGLGIPATISTVHNVYEGGWPRMMAYRLTDGLSSRTTTVCEAAARRFLECRAISAPKCVVIPNAVEMEELVPDRLRRATVREAMGAGSDFIWLAAGRNFAGKDYPNLLRAFALLRGQRTAVQLWIAGEGMSGGSPRLEELAAQPGLRNTVRFLGLRRDIPALLDGADGFAMSSAWEGMPMVLAEAMAMEKPIVATDVGGVRELTGETARLVRSRDAGALAAEMSALMDESATERENRCEAARARVQTMFNLRHRVAEWEALYQLLMEESREHLSGAGGKARENA